MEPSGSPQALPMTNPLHTRDYQHFLAELREARADTGMSQVELGTLIGEDQTYISKCERGVRRIDIVELRRWTGALGVGLPAFIARLEDRFERHRTAARAGQPSRTTRKR